MTTVLAALYKRTITRVLTGFLLREIRIYSEEYFEGELKYMIDAFSKLKYPKGLSL